ncbi:MAG: nitroreductase family protein [Tissierellia bacterium]|nr:nitroreductase family protein [Tissierellia bacterium]
MSIYEVIQNRRSIRKYQDREIPKEILDKILEAGRLAPSASNEQNWKFIMVTEPKLLQKVASSMPQDFGRDAKAILVSIGEKDSRQMRCEQPKATVDLSIATSYMQLVAWEEGIGSCWIGSFYADVVKEALNIPENMTPVALTTLGYPGENPDPRFRKSKDEVISYNKY